MGEILDSDWLRANLLRSDWLPTSVAIYTTCADFGSVNFTEVVGDCKKFGLFEISTLRRAHTSSASSQWFALLLCGSISGARLFLADLNKA